MNKFFAEIIAGLIPFKMERNRWRGVLRFGAFKALILRNRMKHEDAAPKQYLAVCAIAKNEGPYFKEWIEWHLKQGVEKFYIYDNESTDETKDVLTPYIESGVVEYKYFPGRKQQLAAYDDCLNNHRLDMRWLAVIDLDEFLVPVKDASVADFLRGMERFASVEVNWLVYGSGGAKTKEEGGVMQRFRKHSKYDHCLNSMVKSIIDPRRVCNMIGCHEAARVSGDAGDSHGNVITTHFRNRPSQHDVIRINHYAVKSYDEFLGKRARGRARTNSMRDINYFHEYDLNDIEEV